MFVEAGIFVCLVGASGAGKDTLLRLVKTRLAQDPAFLFPRRSVTRPLSAFEDHVVLSEAAYADGLRSGRFALAWKAHGLGYAIDHEALPDSIAGRVVVCNISRDAVAAARRTFPRVCSVLVSAPDTLLAARLAARGRETAADIDERLARNRSFAENFRADFVIENTGSADEGAEKFVSILRILAATPSQATHKIYSISIL